MFSVKKMLLKKNSQNSQENTGKHTCARLWNFATFLRIPFFREHMWWLRIQFAIVGTSVIVNMSIIDFLCCMLWPR